MISILASACTADFSGGLGTGELQQPEETASLPRGSCYSAEGCTEAARSALSFRDSVGINTHVGYAGTVYRSNWPMIRSRLVELGVSHVRDGTFAAGYADISQLVADRYNELNAEGIKGNLLVGHEQSSNGNSVGDRLAWTATKVPGFAIAIEGTNEFDTYGGNPSRVESLRNMQCDIYQRVKSNPSLASLPVIGPSTGAPFFLSHWYQWVGDLSGCLDRGNQHPYPGADPPHRHQSRDLSVSFGWGQTVFGGKPQWVTETGYWNNTPDPLNVSEAASGIYVPRTFLENFRRGIERTMAYELIDLQTGSNAIIDNYGLLRTDGSPKPAFTSLKNILAIVKDTAPSQGALSFGILCHTNCRYGLPDVYPTQDGPIRHVLLSHSSGSYFIAVWSESKIWDGATKTDTPKPPQGFRLQLFQQPSRIEVFDPAIGTSPVSVDTTGNRIIDTVATDGVRIIKISLATPAPPVHGPSVGMAFEAESAAIVPMSSGGVQRDGAASATGRVAMWTYGTLSKQLTTPKPARRVVVRAMGTQCREASGTSAPRITLTIDGAAVGSTAVSDSVWTDHAFSVSVPAGVHDVSLSYDNDYEDAFCNRNVYFDLVTLDDTSLASTVEAEAMVIWASDSAVAETDPAANAGARLFLPTYATASASMTAYSLANRVVIRAKAKACRDATGASAPMIRVTLNGEAMGTISVTSATWADYSLPLSAPSGTHAVAISYVNDYEDSACNRDVYVDTLGLTHVPPPLVLEAEAMAISPGGYAQARTDSSASNGQYLLIASYATAAGQVTTSSPTQSIVVRARAELCAEANGTRAPIVTLHIDGVNVGSWPVFAEQWTSYSFSFGLPAGRHSVAVSYNNDYESWACNRNVHLDAVLLSTE